MASSGGHAGRRLLRLAGHHMGREAGAFAKARANVDAWTCEIEEQGLDAILVTSRVVARP